MLSSKRHFPISIVKIGCPFSSWWNFQRCSSFSTKLELSKESLVRVREKWKSDHEANRVRNIRLIGHLDARVKVAVNYELKNGEVWMLDQIDRSNGLENGPNPPTVVQPKHQDSNCRCNCTSYLRGHPRIYALILVNSLTEGKEPIWQVDNFLSTC